MTGTIRALKHDKGYGFIEGDDKSDRFFHASGLQPPLQFSELTAGQRVTFEPDAGVKGPRAINIARA